jgi:pimeloyl-ACP methyl ester carboxylesterase
MTSFDYVHSGLRFAVSQIGEGRPMVFQHGLCGDATQPADVFPLEAGWRCLTLECRGHGRTEAGAAADLSLATFADDVASLIEAHVAEPIVLGGISMGAALALRLAVLHPDLVRALVLARPAWVLDAAPATMQPNAMVGELLQRHPPAEARAHFEAGDLARRLAVEAPENLASLRGFFTREPIPVTAELLVRISADGPGVTRASAESLRMPTLVIGHERDLIHPLAFAQTLSRLIPGASLVKITPKAESRERYRRDFAAALATFLTQL